MSLTVHTNKMLEFFVHLQFFKVTYYLQYLKGVSNSVLRHCKFSSSSTYVQNDKKGDFISVLDYTNSYRQVTGAEMLYISRFGK